MLLVYNTKEPGLDQEGNILWSFEICTDEDANVLSYILVICATKYTVEWARREVREYKR